MVVVVVVVYITTNVNVHNKMYNHCDQTIPNWWSRTDHQEFRCGFEIYRVGWTSVGQVTVVTMVTAGTLHTLLLDVYWLLATHIGCMSRCA